MFSVNLQYTHYTKMCLYIYEEELTNVPILSLVTYIKIIQKTLDKENVKMLKLTSYNPFCFHCLSHYFLQLLQNSRQNSLVIISSVNRHQQQINITSSCYEHSRLLRQQENKWAGQDYWLSPSYCKWNAHNRMALHSINIKKNNTDI